MRYFITSDLHGYFSVLDRELKRKGFDKEKDTLLTLGDNFDRGEESWEMFEFLSSLPHAVFVRGNHEDLFVDMVERGYPMPYDFSNKTADTACQIYDHCFPNSLSDFDEILRKIKDTPFFRWLKGDFWKDEICFGDYVMTHATEPNESFPTWKEARWANPLDNKIPGKTLVCGHWFAFLGREREGMLHESDLALLKARLGQASRKTIEELSKPYRTEGLIMLDACTSITKECNVLIYDDDKKTLK